MTDQERDRYMEEIREMRQDLKASLDVARSERREDIRELHAKLDDRFFMLSAKFDLLSSEVSSHRTQLKAFVGVVVVLFTSAVTWAASTFKTMANL